MNRPAEIPALPRFLATSLCVLAVASGFASIPPGCKPPELVISRRHPLIILYGPGTGERTVACWAHLPADLKPYCVVTMDPPALDLKERLEGWRRMLRVVQPHHIPIVLQVAGDDPAWTTPVDTVETLIREFPCIKAIQIVEWRCGYYTRFGGDLEMAIPANLRYLAAILKLCAHYGKHLSVQLQSDLAHLACDELSGPFRELLRTYHAYFLPQNECIPPCYYLAQTAAWGFWLAGDCDHWGMEPQWWWWTKGESYFVRPGVFGVEAEMPTDEAHYARFYRAFIIEGALMGATVFSIEPPQDIWRGDGTDPQHFDQVISPTLRQIIEQRLIPSKDQVLARARVAYQMTICKTLHQYDALLQDLELEVAHGYLVRAAYGVLLPHLMKEMIPDTGGRYYFIPLLPVGTPATVLRRFAKILQPGECASVQAYRRLLDHYDPPTPNNNGPDATNRACVLTCGRAVAVLQSRENLFERQRFSADLPRWVTGLRATPNPAGLHLTWDHDAGARSYRVWKRIPGATVYPEWRVVMSRLRDNACWLPGITSGVFGVTAVTGARRRLDGTVNFTDYLLFTTNESPIIEQAVVTPNGSHTAKIAWSDPSLPATQDAWHIFNHVPPSRRQEAEAVLERFRQLITAFDAGDLDRVMSFYDRAYKDSNGYSAEYVRRAWRWWYQRTAVPYAIAQVRTWDTSRAAQGILSFTAWNRFGGTLVWDEPFGDHGRVRIPRHQGEEVTWTWRRDAKGEWKVLHTTPALPNFGEMLWNSRGHDVKHTMQEFADTPASPEPP